MALTYGLRAALLRGASLSSRSEGAARVTNTAIRLAVAQSTGLTPLQVAAGPTPAAPKRSPR